jgi:hypothetical protein
VLQTLVLKGLPDASIVMVLDGSVEKGAKFDSLAPAHPDGLTDVALRAKTSG